MTLLLGYAAILLAVLAIAVASANDTLMKVQLVAVAHWIAYNVIISKLGYDYGVILVCLSSLAAIVTAWVGFEAHSWTALSVVMLWIVAASLTTAFYYFGLQSAYIHYLGLNLTFIGRMGLVGGAGVFELVRRARAVPVRPSPRLSRR